jgi:CRISP-associated protein Cas1
MIKRTVEISKESAHLTARLGQLLLQRDGQTLSSIPCEDLGMVLVDQAGVTYSQAALTALADAGAALVVCGRDHLPAAMLLPLADHTEVVWRLEEQLMLGAALRKQLWRQLVRGKVRAQAVNLPQESPARAKLLDLARGVRSGDPANVEAQAAKIYWAHWLDNEPFRRDPDGGGLNAILNYGYAVLRASIARAIVSAGLLPALGIHHCNRGNSFCLADDLIEPLRPLVDRRARILYREGNRQLNPQVKAGLLEVLCEQVRFKDEKGPLMVALHRMTASLVRCFEGKAKLLEIPKPCISADTDVCG